MSDDVAVCRKDGEPLVWTFEFPGYEWYCVVCGARYGALHSLRADASVELAARHAELTDRYETERSERTGRPVPAIPPQDVLPTCGGCGRQPLPEEGRLDNRGKPSLWYCKTIDGVTTYACSRTCIGKADESSGKRSMVMPW